MKNALILTVLFSLLIVSCQKKAIEHTIQVNSFSGEAIGDSTIFIIADSNTNKGCIYILSGNSLSKLDFSGKKLALKEGIKIGSNLNDVINAEIQNDLNDSTQIFKPKGNGSGLCWLFEGFMPPCALSVCAACKSAFCDYVNCRMANDCGDSSEEELRQSACVACATGDDNCTFWRSSNYTIKLLTTDNSIAQ